MSGEQCHTVSLDRVVARTVWPRSGFAALSKRERMFCRLKDFRRVAHSLRSKRHKLPRCRLHRGRHQLLVMSLP